MPNSRSSKRTEVDPGQGEFFSGTAGRLRPDPHFTERRSPGADVAYGVSVSLEERNEALQSAFTWLGRQASSASFREIGRSQAEGSRTPAVEKIESRYSQDELEGKLETSEIAKTGVEKALDGRLKKAFGYEELADSELFPEVTAKKVEAAFLSGGPNAGSGNLKLTPGHKEGKKEFMARFRGSNHRNNRHTYRRTLKRQSTQINKIKRKNTQSV